MPDSGIAGRFTIVLEGADGSGKSHQARSVREQLTAAGLDVVCPTSDPSRRIRRLYKEMIYGEDAFPDARTSVLLGLADYADATAAAASTPGDVVLFDRYCYSAAADAIALGMDPAHIRPLLALFESPDLVLFVDVPAETALNRKRECTIAEAGGPDFARDYASLYDAFVGYQTRVREAYRCLQMLAPMPEFVVIDGERPSEAVTKDIVEMILARVWRSTSHAKTA